MPSRVLAFLLALAACSGKDDSSVDLYRTCAAVEECTDHPTGADAACVDKGGEGFCTWSCTTDADCTLEADDGWDYVCASFESSEGLYCFPSCRDDGEESEASCPGTLGCRSTGGGSDNQKVCFPSDETAAP